VNWSWFLLLAVVGLTLLTALFLSQRFWYRSLWRVTSKWRAPWLRVAVRVAYVVALVLIIVATAQGFRMGHRGRLIPNDNMITVFAGLWFSSAIFAYLAVKLVRSVDRVWSWARKSYRANSTALPVRQTELSSSPGRTNTAQEPSSGLSVSSISAAAVELLPDPSRRYFFRTATAVAGAAPFLGAMYGFAAERLNYQVRRVEIPIANLPSALDGMRIAQLSDVHLSGYMTRAQIRRAVDMTNALGADLTLLTGD
jgi:hypothetical protein